MKPVTFEHEREYYDVIKRMLRGEQMKDYSGAIGDFPLLGYSDYVKEDVPILFVGFGPRSLKNAGKIYEGAHLHTFMSPEAVARAVGCIREGEREAGKKVGQAKVWTVLATLCNPTEEKYLEYITARLASYLQVPDYGEGLAKINGWDVEQLKEFRQQPAVTSVGSWIDAVASFDQFAAIDKVLPQEWRSAAVGTPRECAERWLEEFEAGADGIIIHACTPEEFEPVLAEYERIRPDHLFEERTNRPA
ncbi:MAG: LLM class flavin-dependent oxidoreductase [Gammaproteobacteria bacterium]|nr:LLM class flavin-dependent oxidoreductase [Gammaproteobacteria bacterium]